MLYCWGKGEMGMDYIVNVTTAESLALHTHDQYEIVCYLGGAGVMRTRQQ